MSKLYVSFVKAIDGYAVFTEDGTSGGTVHKLEGDNWEARDTQGETVGATWETRRAAGEALLALITPEEEDTLPEGVGGDFWAAGSGLVGLIAPEEEEDTLPGEDAMIEKGAVSMMAHAPMVEEEDGPGSFFRYPENIEYMARHANTESARAYWRSLVGA